MYRHFGSLAVTKTSGPHRPVNVGNIPVPLSLCNSIHEELFVHVSFSKVRKRERGRFIASETTPAPKLQVDSHLRQPNNVEPGQYTFTCLHSC
jgi:hypothetical protein